MDTNKLFEDLQPGAPSREWEASFFEKLEKQKSTSDNKIKAKTLVYFSILLLNIFAISYSLKNNKENKTADKYRLLSETLFSNNNY